MKLTAPSVSESNKKSSDTHIANDTKYQGMNCIEIIKEKNTELDLFMAEKRSTPDSLPDKPKRLRVVDSEPILKAPELVKKRHRVQERKPIEIKLSEDTVPYSISENLADTKAELSISQLLKVVPSVRRELLSLYKRVETKELGRLEFEERANTNCRGLVTIFVKRHWAILDTGAECSVMSESMKIEMGLEVDTNDNQIIVTADGTRHNAYGTISGVPIKIANYSFPADILVLKAVKPMLILGTEWFSKYNAVLDLKSKELVLEANNADIVLKLYTKIPNKRIYEEIEIFGFGIETNRTAQQDPQEKEISKVIDNFSDLFVVIFQS
ncbi:hypothetical protein AYI70_g2221 [Smittium culicis]|uniref:DNA damage-inducible protein 1 n=1 Tax=Smittium culicis TaxID=133412 RepID=A0A1R1Y9B1_9FUNG|nr:hypothetical protein AYI70_g2221 [Smittium culicis]